MKTPVYLSKYMQPEIVEQNKEPHNEMLIAGYPGDHHFEMWKEQELVSGFNVDEHIFAYVHDTQTGSSGSPLFRLSEGKALLHGVHSGLADNLEDKVGVLITELTYGFIYGAVQWGHQADYFVVAID